jgi:hypothetical protein
MEEHLTHGWEPDTGADDSLLRRFVHSVADRMAHVAAAAGGNVVRHDDVLIADARSPVLFDNGAVLLQPPALIDVADVVARVRDTCAPDQGFVILSAWHLGDLRPHGLTLMGYPPFMFRPAGGSAPPRPDGLEIVEVHDAETLSTFLEAIVEGYPMPGGEHSPIADPRVLGGPVRFFVGYVDGRPVATSGVHLGNGLNDVEWVSTMSHARRRGYGEALTWAATLADPSLPAALIASDDGQPIYERMGYVRLLRMAIWWCPPA